VHGYLEKIILIYEKLQRSYNLLGVSEKVFFSVTVFLLSVSHIYVDNLAHKSKLVKKNENSVTSKYFEKITNENGSAVEDAATILQKATRGMLARKSFRNVQSQAMASLVIQRSLFRWHKRKFSSETSR
jgi:hypothetical protein